MGSGQGAGMLDATHLYYSLLSLQPHLLGSRSAFMF